MPVRRLPRVISALLGVVVMGVVAPAVHAAPAPAPGDPVEVAAGCPPEPEARAVFVGRVEATDWRAARFFVVQVRAGSLEGYEVGGLVDVDFLEDLRFLEIGESYVVGAGVDPFTRRLVSKVREPAPRFGGNQVVALDEVECPVYQDPVRTLDLDGTPVESGVLTPLYGEGRALARALVLPLVWAFTALLALAGLKAFLVWLIRGLTGSSRTPPPSARRTETY